MIFWKHHKEITNLSDVRKLPDSLVPDWINYKVKYCEL